VFRVLANAVVVVHLLFIAFILLGGLFALRWTRLAWIHLPLGAWGVLVQWMSWICPLTPLENSLRARSGEPTYDEGFVEHYLVPVLYPVGIGQRTHIVLGVIVLGTNAVIYALLLARLRARHRIAAAPSKSS
jgi:hypothetical protein